MFGFIGGGTGLSVIDPTKERDPPPPPTPVTFPNIYPDISPRSWTQDNAPNFAQSIAGLRKPTDITINLLQDLNITIKTPCPIDEFLPAANNGTSYIPPLSWFTDPRPQEKPTAEPSEKPKKKLVNGNPIPDREAFHTRAKEILIDNDTAFRVLSRTPLPNQKLPRLAHFRRFFEQLETLAHYWDDSIDNYIPHEDKPGDDKGEDTVEGANSNDVHEDEPRKKAKPSPPSPVASPKPIPEPAGLPVITKSKEADNPMKDKYRAYTGRRTGTGTACPPQFLSETVKTLLDPLIWPFGLSTSAPRRVPAVFVKHVILPVRQTAGVWKFPNDRQMARKGYLEGPVCGIQCRPETDFEPSKSDSYEQACILDIVREVSGLLHIAQERYREGRTETKPGDGKWWTTVPRWGGGPGGEIGEASAADEDLTASREKGKAARDAKALVARKGKLVEAWKTLKPGNGFWDAKTMYNAVGRAPGQQEDQVFMVSALNYHVSVLKLRVNRSYIEYFETGKLPDPLPEDTSWCNPIVERTEWFNLLDIDGRRDSARVIWGVSAYQMRPMSADADMKS